MANYTPNINLYLPNRNDTDIEVDTSLTDNFNKIDTSLSNIGINVKSLGADATGGTDSTTIFQNALNQGGTVIVPTGTYLVGALTIPSNTKLIGIGKVTLKHNINTGYVASGWNRAMITNQSIPVYADPSASSRPNVVGANVNISIENITLDGNGQSVQGMLMVAVDNFNAKNVTLQNMSGATTYFVGMRYSKILDCTSQNCAGDCFAMTDKHLGGKRGFSTDVVFENCLVQNCGSTPSQSDPIPSMFELSDGMSNITFLNCRAINNNGCGFDLHIHANLADGVTSDWDMKNIHFINCRSENNTMTTTTDAGVSGFVIGQCPSNSTFRNINLVNCTSIGSQTGFATQEGSQTGYREDITIDGGHFENAFTSGGTINSINSVIYVGKSVRRFKISKANLYGATDSYGFYSYGTNDGVKISDVSINNCYIPLGLTHSGGRVEISNVSFVVTNPSGALSTVCLCAECDDVVINGLIGSLDQSKYSSSILRFIQPKKISATGILIENTGTVGNNGIQLDTVGYATLTGNIVKNFTNAVYFSNTSTSVVSVGNNFKTCTNKYNTTPSYLVDAGNAI